MLKATKAIVTVVALIIVSSSAALPQTPSGSISGVVTDQSGAVVPNASVTVTEVETAIARTVKTDSGGRYNVPALTSGHYQLQIRAEGFKTTIRSGIQVTVGSAISVDSVLELVVRAISSDRT